MSYLLHPRQTNNKKGCCSSNASGSVLDLRDLKQGGGWKEACGSQAPVPRWAVALKLCSSQKGKGGSRSTRPLSRNSGGISIQALDSGVQTFSHPASSFVSYTLVYPGCRTCHIPQTWISTANRTTNGHGLELSLVSQVTRRTQEVLLELTA